MQMACMHTQVAPVSGYEYSDSESLANRSVLDAVPIMIHHGLADKKVRAAGCCEKQVYVS